MRAMAASLFRSEVIRAAFSPAKALRRPPWALAEAEFSSACTGCADCIGACPESILVADRDNHPVVNFALGPCTFCGACVRACGAGAFAPAGAASEPAPASAPWAAKPTVGETCLSTAGVICRTCADSCDRRAIMFRLAVGGHATPMIDSTRCNGCGACVAPCPAAALTIG